MDPRSTAMKRVATLTGILLIFGALLFALSNLDHRRDRNVPGATTTAGQNSLVQSTGASTGQTNASGRAFTGNAGSATGTTPSTSGGGNTGLSGGRSDSMGPAQGPTTGGDSRRMQQGQQDPSSTKK